jgi:hypothetical protein
MKSKKGKKPNRQKHESGLSLAPLTFEDALRGLVQVKPHKKKQQ